MADRARSSPRRDAEPRERTGAAEPARHAPALGRPSGRLPAILGRYAVLPVRHLYVVVCLLLLLVVLLQQGRAATSPAHSAAAAAARRRSARGRARPCSRRPRPVLGALFMIGALALSLIGQRPSSLLRGTAGAGPAGGPRRPSRPRPEPPRRRRHPRRHLRPASRRRHPLAPPQRPPRPRSAGRNRKAAARPSPAPPKP